MVVKVHLSTTNQNAPNENHHQPRNHLKLMNNTLDMIYQCWWIVLMIWFTSVRLDIQTYKSVLVSCCFLAGLTDILYHFPCKFQLRGSGLVSFCFLAGINGYPASLILIGTVQNSGLHWKQSLSRHDGRCLGVWGAPWYALYTPTNLICPHVEQVGADTCLTTRVFSWFSELEPSESRL